MSALLAAAAATTHVNYVTAPSIVENEKTASENRNDHVVSSTSPTPSSSGGKDSQQDDFLKELDTAEGFQKFADGLISVE